MTAPEPIVRAIGAAVELQGGDLDDARDLVQTWERLHDDRRGRIARLRYDASHARCTCAHGNDDETPGPRCARCHGVRP
jgi:hypothetical protein